MAVAEENLPSSANSSSLYRLSFLIIVIGVIGELKCFKALQYSMPKMLLEDAKKLSFKHYTNFINFVIIQLR